MSTTLAKAARSLARCHFVRRGSDERRFVIEFVITHHKVIRTGGDGPLHNLNAKMLRMIFTAR